MRRQPQVVVFDGDAGFAGAKRGRGDDDDDVIAARRAERAAFVVRSQSTRARSCVALVMPARGAWSTRVRAGTSVCPCANPLAPPHAARAARADG